MALKTLAENKSKGGCMGVSWKFWLFIIVAGVIIKLISGPGKVDPGVNDCNCEYKDTNGSWKRINTSSYQDCIQLFGGEWLDGYHKCDELRPSRFFDTE